MIIDSIPCILCVCRAYWRIFFKSEILAWPSQTWAWDNHGIHNSIPLTRFEESLKLCRFIVICECVCSQDSVRNLCPMYFQSRCVRNLVETFLFAIPGTSSFTLKSEHPNPCHLFHHFEFLGPKLFNNASSIPKLYSSLLASKIYPSHFFSILPEILLKYVFSKTSSYTNNFFV